MTQLRSVSGLMPSCSPIRFNAPNRVAGSRRASTAIRVARSRSSSGYFLGAAMTLILTWIESLHQTRGGTGRQEAGQTPALDVAATDRRDPISGPHRLPVARRARAVRQLAERLRV